LWLALARGLPVGDLRLLFTTPEESSVPLQLPPTFDSMYHMYQKLSKLVGYISTSAGRGLDPDTVLKSIEAFGQDLGQWLKVAGGEKASLTAAALRRRRPAAHEVSAEFGAFVGYSAIRFAAQLRTAQQEPPRRGGGLAGLSFEVDPVHAAVARHLIDAAGLAGAGEVWLGLLQDTVPLLDERGGCQCLAFSFFDQRGTTFHEDLALLQRLALVAAPTMLVADNVNKPGAPEFLWHLSHTRRFATEIWSMSEFASASVEDWQSLSLG